jgi:hypothetical protein
MLSERFYGGARRTTLSSATAFDLTFYGKRFQTINPTVSGVNVRLPSALNQPLGAFFYVHNTGASENVAVKDNGGTTLATLTPAHLAKCRLVRNTTAAGVWSIEAYSVNQADGFRSYNEKTRSLPSELPAICDPAPGILVRCDDPSQYIWIKDDALLPTNFGKVFLLTDGHCYKMYAVRNSGKHGIPVPAGYAIHTNCCDCLKVLGLACKDGWSFLDADDSALDFSWQGTNVVTA